MKILINGIMGRMGGFVYDALKTNDKISAACGVDKFDSKRVFDVPVFKSLEEVNVEFDAIIDFSKHAAIFELLDYATKNKKPCVLATTGYSTSELSYIENASKKIPIFLSGNMSLGINVLTKLVSVATKLLGDNADIEIVETHHNQKIDAPSGTALMLLNSVKKVKEKVNPVYGREGIVGVRGKDEVGLHAIRGGTVVGKHEVSFFINNEVITLKHEAESKAIFANGSIKAAMFLANKPPKLYDMDDIFQLTMDN